jgi:hypothetical protein
MGGLTRRGRKRRDAAPFSAIMVVPGLPRQLCADEGCIGFSASGLFGIQQALAKAFALP